MDQLSSAFGTKLGPRVQLVVMPFGDPKSWMLADHQSAVVEPAEGFVPHEKFRTRR